MTDLAKLIERVTAGEIKALSIKQPYPHHIFHRFFSLPDDVLASVLRDLQARQQ